MPLNSSTDHVETESKTSAHSALPTVSIVMPIRNEAAFIEQSLGAVLAQDYPRELLEIIIVDGMSEDGTREIVQGLQAQNPHLRLLDNPAKIVPPAMNLAIAHATGDVIVRIDGHAVIAPDYVSAAIETLQRTGADMVGGPMRPYGTKPVAEAIALAVSTPFGVGGGRFHYTEHEEEVDTVYVGICRRDLYIQLGGFDEELVRAEDADFSSRIRQNGGRIVCNPAIRSRYYNRATFQLVRRQYFITGFWKVRILQKHPGQFVRQLVPPAFVAVLLGSLLLSPFHKIAHAVFLFSAVSYTIANLLASLSTARSSGRWKLLPLLPVAFASLHVAYGIGFLCGLVRFRNRWKSPTPAEESAAAKAASKNV